MSPFGFGIGWAAIAIGAVIGHELRVQRAARRVASAVERGGQPDGD